MLNFLRRRFGHGGAAGTETELSRITCTDGVSSSCSSQDGVVSMRSGMNLSKISSSSGSESFSAEPFKAGQFQNISLPIQIITLIKEHDL